MSKLSSVSWLCIVTVLNLVALCDAGCPSQCQCKFYNTDVDCSSKGLTTVPEGLQDNITVLFLTNNSISVLESSQFSSYSSLTKLDISKNIIEDVHEDAFTGLNKLEELDISENGITSLKSQSFASLGALLELNLSNNSLSKILEDLLTPCKSLKFLEIKYNNLTEDIFSVINKITWITRLDISGNNINFLPYLMFYNMKNLITLTIKNGPLRSIDSNALIGMNSLQLLDISYNQLNELRREMFQPFVGMSYLDISGNPLDCTCGTKQVQDWLTSAGTVSLNTAFCTDPDGTLIDVEFGNLEHLCTNLDGTQPPPVCTNNSSIILNVVEISGSTATFQWGVTGIELESQPFVSFREFGVVEEEKWEQISENAGFVISLRNLEESIPYVICVYETTCDTRDCVDFIGAGSLPSTASPTNDDNNEIALAVGLTAGGFGVVIIILIIVVALFGFGYCKPKDKIEKHFSPQSNGLASQPKVCPSLEIARETTPTSYRYIADDGLYEAIPGDNSRNSSLEHNARSVILDPNQLDSRNSALSSPNSVSYSPKTVKGAGKPTMGKQIVFRRQPHLADHGERNPSTHFSEPHHKDSHQQIPLPVPPTQDAYLEPSLPPSARSSSARPAERQRPPSSPHVYNEPNEYEN